MPQLAHGTSKRWWQFRWRTVASQSSAPCAFGVEAMKTAEAATKEAKILHHWQGAMISHFGLRATAAMVEVTVDTVTTKSAENTVTTKSAPTATTATPARRRDEVGWGWRR